MADVGMNIVLGVTGTNAVLGAIKGVVGALGTGGLGGALASVGLAAGGLGLALGVQSVQAAGSFQTAMLDLQSHAGLAASQVGVVNQALLQMGPAVGKGPTELAQAMYPVLSGFSGISNQATKTQLSLMEVKLAAESVAGSTTSVTTVTNAASAAYNALGLQTNDTALAQARMQNLFDVMNRTVQDGNMKFSDYSEVAGKLATSIKGTSVTFNEANAALATMTNSGYSARLSQTYLSNLFTELDVKTDSLAANSSKLGIAFDENRFKTLSLGDQIKYLNQITNGNQDELLKIFNGNTTALRSYNALSTGMKSYQGNLEDLNHSQGATALAFQTASSGYQFALQRLSAAFQSLQISIGLIFLPVLTQVVNAVVPIITTWAVWLAANQQLVSYVENDLMRAFQIFNAVAFGLGMTLGFYLTRAAQPVTAELKNMGEAARGPAIEGMSASTSWIESTGMPVYAAFAKLLKDVTGGSFQSVRQDALNLQATLSTIKLPDFSTQLTGLKGLGGQGLSTGLTGLQGVGSQLMTTFNPLIQWFQTTVSPVLSRVGYIVDKVLNPPLQTLNYLGTTLYPVFVGFGNWWQANIAPMFDKGAKSGGGLNTILHQLYQIWKDLWGAIGPVVEIIVRLGIVILEHALPPLMFILGLLLQLVGLLVGHFLTGVDIALKKLKEFADWFIGTGIPNISKFLDFFQSMPGKIAGYLGGLGNTIAGKLKDGINSGLIDPLNNLISKIDNIHVNVPGVGNVGFDIGLLPHLASGGVLTRGGLVTVGEFGAETVALPPGAAVYPHGSVPAGAGGVTNIFYINLSTIARSQSEVRNLVDMLEQEIAHRVRLQTPGYASGGVFS